MGCSTCCEGPVCLTPWQVWIVVLYQVWVLCLMLSCLLLLCLLLRVTQTSWLSRAAWPSAWTATYALSR